MKITKNVLRILNEQITNMPPETGGILGSKNGTTITDVILDEQPITSSHVCSYIPNTEFLNQQIAIWEENGVAFKGVFHTHFGSAKTLSTGDIKYIHTIMENMPDEIEFLYFPIFVLPERKLICYRADRKDGKTSIHSDLLDFSTN